MLAIIPEQTEKSDLKTLALVTGRAILTSAVAGTMPTADMKIVSAANSAARSANSATLSARSAARSALSAALSAARSASSAAFHDAGLTASDTDPLLTPLWVDPPFEGLFKETWETFKTDILPNAPEFTFWHDWYQGFLDGKPLDWDLQREVALIPDEDWDKGAAHIATLIDPIWERYKLKERIEELEALLPKDKISRHGIGGNNPPPDIGEIVSSEQIISITYGAIGVLKTEIEKEEPDKSLLKWAIKALKKVLKAIGILGGVFITAGVAAAGTKYGEDILKSVIEHASNWYNYLP